MKKCKSCQTEINSKATKCPHCQADQRGWFKRHPIFAGLLVLIVIGIIGSATSGSKNSDSSNQSQQKTQENKPTTVPAVPTIAFDKNLGNNSVAAGEAQLIQVAFDSTMPGVIKDVYIECDPQDMGGKSEADYEKSVLQIALVRITVDGDRWDNTSDAVKKDFVAGIIKAIQVNIGVYPTLTVSDGIRTVAEGSWSVWNGQADVTLK